MKKDEKEASSLADVQGEARRRARGKFSRTAAAQRNRETRFTRTLPLSFPSRTESPFNLAASTADGGRRARVMHLHPARI